MVFLSVFTHSTLVATYGRGYPGLLLAMAISSQVSGFVSSGWDTHGRWTAWWCWGGGAGAVLKENQLTLRSIHRPVYRSNLVRNAVSDELEVFHGCRVRENDLWVGEN